LGQLTCCLQLLHLLPQSTDYSPLTLTNSLCRNQGRCKLPHLLILLLLLLSLLLVCLIPYMVLQAAAGPRAVWAAAAAPQHPRSIFQAVPDAAKVGSLPVQQLRCQCCHASTPGHTHSTHTQQA
jgi:hypothetical protein